MIATGGKAMSIINSCTRTLGTVLAQLQLGADSKKPVTPVRRQRRFEQLEDRRLMSVTQDANGWTVVGASADTRTIYVSDSTGNDANNGLTPETAKKTIAAGMSLMRGGMPDHILLKKGDTFTNQSFTQAGQLFKDDDGGRSATEPWLLSSYGTGERPKILTVGNGNGSDVIASVADGVEYLAIIGLHFEQVNRVGDEGLKAIGLGCTVDGDASDIIIEDNYISGYSSGIVVGGYFKDVSIRRNSILNSWSSSSHSQGLYSDYVDGLLVEENLFDHNGWKPGTTASTPEDQGGPTIFNHSMYITHYTRNATIRGNISSRASSMGLKFQPNEGTHYITNNLFVGNGYALQVGGGQPQYQVGKSGATIYANDNVIVEASNNPGGGMGVTISNVNSGSFNNNIIANKAGTGNQFALSLQDGMGWETMGYGVRNFVVQNNTVYNWEGVVRVMQPTQAYQGGPLPVMSNIDFINNTFQEPNSSYTGKLLEIYTGSAAVNSFTGDVYSSAGSAAQPFRVGGTSMNLASWRTATGESNATQQTVEYFDPTRTTLTYAASRGLTTYDAFIAEASRQSHTNWRTEFTADAVNDYIRAGYVHDDVGVTPLPSPSQSPPTAQVIQQQSAPQPQQQQLLRQQLPGVQRQQQNQLQQQQAPAAEDSTQLSGGSAANLLVLVLSPQSSATDSDAGDGDRDSVRRDSSEGTAWESAADEVFGELGELLQSVSA